MARTRTPVVLTPLGRYECRQCGIRFAWQSTRPNGGGKPPAFCSTKCQHDSRKTLRGTCLYCGAEVWSHKPATYCSPACHQPNPPRSELPADHWARWYGATSPLPPSPPPPSTPILVVSCVDCDRLFVVPYWRGRSKTCDGCRATRNLAMKRQAKHRRRARKRDAYVADVYRLDVYNRDGWRCHICRRRVRRDKVAPHPLAPTIDHIVPLAAGGTHEPANCATAHFVCNATKGDRGGGEQLALIG